MTEIIQNKANLEQAQIGVTSFITSEYEKLRVFEVQKTKPILSYCVLRIAYCENEFEKTKPGSIWVSVDETIVSYLHAGL